MKLLKRKWFLPLVIVLMLTAYYFSNPFLRVTNFVFRYHCDIEHPLMTYNGVPVIRGVDAHNTWEGEHTMTEFILFTSGVGSETTYYGCYYSWDDVPLAFQNLDVSLTQCGHDSWKWKDEGDNWGKTRKIMDNWYYFEASF